MDIDTGKIEGLREGIIPFHEPGLQQLVHAHSGHALTFSTDMSAAVEWSDTILICVDTPSNIDGSANLTSVETIVRDIAVQATSYRLVVSKSTVPVRTGERIAETLKRHGKPGVEFDVASVPEFLREGNAVEDTMHPHRIVLGAETSRAIEKLRTLFQPFSAPVIVTDVTTAEMIKHASNSFLATKISYINAIANICEAVDADVTVVATAMGLDPRIGEHFLDAGVGYGGSCFPKDVSAFIHVAQDVGYEFDLLRAVQSINTNQQIGVASKLQRAMGDIRGKTIALLGLAFKADTDDIRESPAIAIGEDLLSRGAVIRAYDPAAVENARRVFGNRVEFGRDVYETIAGADAIVAVTAWPEFDAIDWPTVRRVMKGSVVLDGRNIWNPAVVRATGLTYLGVGR
jgi:UDPglucose 6-dehydrogenase